MTDIKTSNVPVQQATLQTQQMVSYPYAKGYAINAPRTIRDEFVIEHKKNGLFEKLYNGIKNLTGLGTGSKKVEAAVKKAESGEISNEEARATIQKYRSSQANSEQLIGDTASIAVSAGTFFGLRKLVKTEGTKALLNEKYIMEGSQSLGPLNNYAKQLMKIIKSNKKLTFLVAGTAAIAGGYTKDLLLRFNRIGSKEFDYDKKDFNGAKTREDKMLYKIEKKEKKKEKTKANLRNFVSGAINGLMMPLTLVGGAIAGVPLYLAGNTLNRYFIGNRTEEKSANGFVDNLKNDSISHAALAVAAAVPLIKKGRWTKVFDENLGKAFEKLKDVKLNKSGYEGKTTYQELENILMGSNEINRIVWGSGPIEERIQKLTEENIFAVKFKQIANDGTEFTRALKEDCPPTRCFINKEGIWDFSKVQDYVNKALGNSEYKIEKCLGVGTVAETYLAKGPDGKEVCLKVLKEGITEEKILADKQKFVEIVKGLSDKTAEEKEYLLKNIDDLADGIIKEVDFQNEYNAALELAKHTKVAKVVKPIEVKNGVYVMEKAEGISLASLIELNSAKNYRDALLNNPAIARGLRPSGNSNISQILKNTTNKEETIKALDVYIKKIEDRTPQFGDITLTKDDMKCLIEEYEQVLVEQFNKVEKDGKILHADIHPGNIFIDINALRAVKEHNGIIQRVQAQLGRRNSGQIFTLIDKGNTIKQTAEQSMRSINLSSYIDRANVPDIAEYVLEGAVLPKGMKQEEAITIISDELKKCFFDNQTALDKVTNESLITMSSNIMRKHGIMPSDTQLNLNKARKSANNSLFALIESMAMAGLKDVKDITSLMKFVGSCTKDGVLLKNEYNQFQAVQEKLNLLQMTPAQKLKQMKNPNLLATNSEDYLVYKLKQSMKQAPDIPALEF